MPIDKEEVRPYAKGRWNELVTQIAGIPDDYLTTKHGPCPKCGGDNRWRVYKDFGETGGAICGRCEKGKQLGDGFAVIEWYCGVSFSASVDRVAAYLGITSSRGKPFPPAPRTKIDKPKKKPPKDVSGDLDPLLWDRMQVAIWCMYKKPLTPDSVQAAGGFIARYRKYATVLAFPVHSNAAKVENWVIYNITGGKLAVGSKKDGYEQVKVKNLNEVAGWPGKGKQP